MRMLPSVTNLTLLGLVLLVLLREVMEEMRRRRFLEWRIQILEMLAAAARRGYPLVPVLERAAAAGPKGLSRICRNLARKMREGVDLSRAMADVAPECFPAACAASIGGAEGSGALADALEDLATRSDERQSIGYRMRVALAYPAILAIALLGAHLTVGRVYGYYAQRWGARGFELGEFLGWIGLGIVVVGLLTLQTLIHRRKLLGRPVRDAWAGLISKTRSGRFLAAGEFLGALSHVVAAGVPLPAAIRRVAAACGSPGLSAAVCHAAAALEGGETPERAWRRTWLPEFAIVTVSAVARSSNRNHAETLRRTAGECRRRWLQSRERSLALMPILCVAAAGLLLAIDFAALYQLEFDAYQRVTLW